MRTPASLGHFEKVDPLVTSDIMSEQMISANQRAQGNKGRKVNTSDQSIFWLLFGNCEIGLGLILILVGNIARKGTRKSLKSI